MLIATGVYKARDLQAPGVGFGNIVPALDYLTATNRNGLGDKVPDFDIGALNAKGKNVVVIGGGDTAMDCVRTAVRQGATSVKCLYRRDRANMPGSQREVAHAEEEGVEFVWLARPKPSSAARRTTSSACAPRASISACPMPPAARRRGSSTAPHFNVEADLVIKALGFDPEDLPATVRRAGSHGHPLGHGARSTHRTMMTSLAGVFAAGDIVRGASLVVWAIRDGRDAADSIDAYLKAKSAAARCSRCGVGTRQMT